ncbi:MAG TPA: DmsC/YnfH family molybdoenzyme membrane anchor subunit, partial [Verrucomicrobiae bacterium]|nr:DmsC/YnfH family molybdoenzyme membrane anchor subunit [Verrucomicrobiae bacterium]
PPTSRPPSEKPRTLIDDLLSEQQELTAVEKFSRAHDQHAVRGELYRDLLPATPPAPGQQYAFEVDLDKCTGCKACVSACHSLNGLDDNETWRSVGLLVGDPAQDYRARRGAAAFQQNVTTACHHCVDPGCLNGCPVLAYDKDAVTGIVRHLDDQCIGCQYCVMMCPYEVPQYSKERGIVRKCDMCHSRLAVGEAPACVQACPTSAIKITVVEQSKVRGKYRQLSAFNFQPASTVTSTANNFLPATPNPAITLPTTRFVTARTLPENLFAGDDSAIRRADSHLPLVILLVLSQLAIGASVAAIFVKPELPLLLTALVVGTIALVAGSLHLGQPLKAWRSFLGWRKSWFSREVIALAGFVVLVGLAAATMWSSATEPFENILAPLAGLTGLATVACSAMIYVRTRRDFWSASRSFPKFFGTTLLLGTATTMAVVSFTKPNSSAPVASAIVVLVATVAKLAVERCIFTHLVDEETAAQTPLNKTARLLNGELNGLVRGRIALGVIGGAVLPLIAVGQTASVISWLAVVAAVVCVAGEFIERYLFFTAVVTQKMPGGLAS